jgi:indolepyruvate ferredoxin oxidoreductase
VVNADLAPTAQFVKDTGTRYRGAEMLDSIRAACRETIALPGATRVTEELGDAVYLNVYLLGIAYQRGLVPLSAEAIGRALELNGAQVALNKEAFARGRVAAMGALQPPSDAAATLDSLVARRVADLTAYQNARYAKEYAGFVARVRAAEQAALPGEERLSRAVATQLHRLMAYKDEYEVARLHALPDWRDALAQGFTGTQRIEMHLAPPAMGAQKRRFGPWMFRAMGWLRHGKALRGTALDPFGRTEERRTERALPGEFRDGVERFLAGLPGSHALACDWAEAWAGVKGFGPVKARNLAAVRTRLAQLGTPAIAAE